MKIIENIKKEFEIKENKETLSQEDYEFERACEILFNI